MQFKSLAVSTVILSVTMLMVSCERKDPQATQTQKELQETKETLVKMQESLQKIESDLGDLGPKPAAAKVAAAGSQLKHPEDYNKIADELAANIEALKTKVESVNRSLDELQQQVYLLRGHKTSLMGEKNSAASGIGSAQDPNIIPAAVKSQPAQKPQDAVLAKKLQDAESYVQSGNWPAAERLALEIQAVNPKYPGLDALLSRIQNMKMRMSQ